MLEQIDPLTDLFLWDYKATRDSVSFTGAEREKILGNLHYAVMMKARIRLRCPIVPGLGDNDEHLAAIARLSQEYELDGVYVLPYHNMGAAKSRRLGGTAWIAYKLAEYGCRDFRIM